ncbi:DUF115 domain-containing protein [bacterium]|nr:DUF115 domain-containing protein [bacterium]
MIFLPPLDRSRLVTCGDAASLWNSAAGSRIVVAAAGPSLQKDMDILHRADLVVAALRAAPLVQALGRTPDLVVAAGFRGYFVPQRLPRAPYLVDLRTHPDVFDAVPGRRFLAITDWDQPLGLDGPAVCGASSALAALDVAAHLGAARIFLAGWDVLGSRPGTPGRSPHVRGLNRFLKAHPHLRLSRWILDRDVRYERRIRSAVRAARRPAPWLSKLRHLDKRRRNWGPFWGPDYSRLNISSERMLELLKRQRIEESRTASTLRLLDESPVR